MNDATYTFGSRVWVVGWQSAGALPAEDCPQVALLLSASMDAENVKLVVQSMWNASSLSFQEQLDAATTGKPPYLAEINRAADGSWIVSCGHNPWLEAKVVPGVDVSQDANGKQHVVVHTSDQQDEAAL